MSCKPDLLFLDMQMPKLDGFEVLELIDQRDGGGVRYRVRSICDARVRCGGGGLSAEAVHARNDFGLRWSGCGAANSRRPAAVPRDLRQAARAPGEYLERMVVKDGPRVHVIPAARLDYAEAQDDYVALRSEGKSWLKQQTISSLEAALDPRRFLRIHRSLLVNVERIARVEPNTKDTWLAVLRDGAQVPVSRGGYARFREIVSEG